jgi:hypothetical protein
MARAPPLRRRHLTNSDGGTSLRSELFNPKDWVLRHFVGLHYLPAPPRRLGASELAQYEGHYAAEDITVDNQVEFTGFQLTGQPDGTLQGTLLGSGETEAETGRRDASPPRRSSSSTRRITSSMRPGPA